MLSNLTSRELKSERAHNSERLSTMRVDVFDGCAWAMLHRTKQADVVYGVGLQETRLAP